MTADRPGPVTSDAPDDKVAAEKWKFWFVNVGGISITVWIDEESEIEDGFVNAWADEACTLECVINMAHVYYASQVD